MKILTCTKDADARERRGTDVIEIGIAIGIGIGIGFSGIFDVDPDCDPDLRPYRPSSSSGV
jgi:hypothetical protein